MFIIPLCKSNETNAEVILLNGKARRRSGAGTMTEEKRSHLEESAGTSAVREAHFLTSQILSFVSFVLQSGIIPLIAQIPHARD
jgi:hypothetical protein